MMKTFPISVVLSLYAVALPAAPLAVEISPDKASWLPTGREADGIVGDFLLRNDRIEAVVSGNQPNRRANMSTFYGADGVTPGCLFDLGIRGKSNDQLVIFSPAGQKGPVSWVRVVKDGSDGEAVVETVTTAAKNRGMELTHRYTLKDGWPGLRIETTWKNATGQKQNFATEDVWKSFSKTGEINGIRWGDAIDPREKTAYACEPGKDAVTLEPGASVTSERFLAVGGSPGEAVGLVLEQRGETTPLELLFKDQNGAALTNSHAMLAISGKEVPVYPDPSGRAVLRLPAGAYPLTFQEIGREAVKSSVTVVAGTPARIEGILGPQAGVAFDVSDNLGRSLPCKAMFKPLSSDGKPPKLDLGPSNRAAGCVDQWHSAVGKFQVGLPPGKYEVTVGHGMEYGHVRREIEVHPGKMTAFAAKLVRQVDTTGWISSDFHNHTTQSGDNTCGVDDRIINLAAEQLEFCPTTEHNRLYDWTPHIKKLGLESFLSTVPGMECTGRAEHLNAFPFTPEPGKQDNGAPPWNEDARITALTLRHWQKTEPDRFIQVNHPSFERCFADRDLDGKADEGFIGIAQMVDAWEVENTMDDGILQTAPFRVWRDPRNPSVRKAEMNREFLWLQLLNQGHRIKAVAAADAHTVHGNGAGGWRNYFPSETDEPARINWREISQHAKAGRCLITNGPFLQVSREGRTVAGGEFATNGAKTFNVSIKVQCADWVEIDRVLVLVNGRQLPECTWTTQTHPQFFKQDTVRFDQTLEVLVKTDAHLIFVAYGLGGNLEKGFGTSAQHQLQPCAYLNPCYVDVDGGGFKPNNDTLDWDIPVGTLTLEKALKAFEARGLKEEQMGLPLRQ